MSKQLAQIDSELAAWIAQQKVFFVATAPLSSNGHVNISPKGGDSFRTLTATEVAFQDYTGSGIETTAHLRENGRIVVMFCGFEGAPRIVRLHGRGEVAQRGDARFEELASKFPRHPGVRSIIHVRVDRVSSSCGHGVPVMEFKAPRDTLERWCEAKGSDQLIAYRRVKNASSIDGLPGLLPE
jgi:hypothetical protein